jgi:hypothetical protein
MEGFVHLTVKPKEGAEIITVTTCCPRCRLLGDLGDPAGLK